MPSSGELVRPTTTSPTRRHSVHGESFVGSSVEMLIEHSRLIPVAPHLHRFFRREGIAISFPTRTVDMAGGVAGTEGDAGDAAGEAVVAGVFDVDAHGRDDERLPGEALVAGAVDAAAGVAGGGDVAFAGGADDEVVAVPATAIKVFALVIGTIFAACEIASSISSVAKAT